MIRHPDSNLQIAEKIELALSSQNKRVNTEGTNIVTNEFNREDYQINKTQTKATLDSQALSLQSLQQNKADIAHTHTKSQITDFDVGNMPFCKVTYDEDNERYVLTPQNGGTIPPKDSWFFLVFETGNVCRNINTFRDSAGTSYGTFAVYNGNYYCHSDNVLYRCYRASSGGFTIYNESKLHKLYFCTNSTTYWARIYPLPVLGEEFIFYTDGVEKTGAGTWYWQHSGSYNSYFYLDDVRMGKTGEFTLPAGYYRGKITGTLASGANIQFRTISTTGQALTFDDSGSGEASGTTFDGLTEKKISYNTVGAAAASHTHDTISGLRVRTAETTFSHTSTTYTNQKVTLTLSQGKRFGILGYEVYVSKDIGQGTVTVTDFSCKLTNYYRYDITWTFTSTYAGVTGYTIIFKLVYFY